jgi:hypothetical protein
MSCDDLRLELAIDKSCSFNGEQVERFTVAVISKGGDHTIAFWAKLIEKLSLNNGQFNPSSTLHKYHIATTAKFWCEKILHESKRRSEGEQRLI